MSVSSSSVTNRTPLADPGRWRTSTELRDGDAATITRCAEIARWHVTVGREVPSQEGHGVRAQRQPPAAIIFHDFTAGRHGG
jgi:hypothetical protein